MDPRLSKLIVAYQARVAEAVAVMERAGFQRPRSDTEWAGAAGPPHGELVAGYTFFKHGFGCAVHGPGFRVHFDFGESGQIDGFEPSRLKGFAANQLGSYGLKAEDDIDEMFKEAQNAGEFVFSGYLLSYLRRGAG
jgi:hypothetical protein